MRHEYFFVFESLMKAFVFWRRQKICNLWNHLNYQLLTLFIILHFHMLERFSVGWSNILTTSTFLLELTYHEYSLSEVVCGARSANTSNDFLKSQYSCQWLMCGSVHVLLAYVISVCDKKGNLEARLRYDFSLKMLPANTSIPSLNERACSDIYEADDSNSIALSVISTGRREDSSPFRS